MSLTGWIIISYFVFAVFGFGYLCAKDAKGMDLDDAYAYTTLIPGYNAILGLKGMWALLMWCIKI